MNSHFPLLLTFTMQHSYSNTYKPYWVYIRVYRYSGSWYHEDRLIYTGKTFCSELDANNSTTTIDVAPILREFAWRQKIVFEADTQRWLPYEYRDYPVGRVLAATPIEMDDNYLRLLNGYIMVEVGTQGGGYGSGDVATDTLLPTQYRARLTPANPYSATGSNFLYSELDDLAILPEIPLLKTSNYWMSAVMAIDRSGRASSTQTWFEGVPNGNNKLECNPQSTNGNYCLSPSLKYLFLSLGNEASEGGYVYYEGKTDGGGFDPFKVAKISKCDADYYVAWITPQGGWQSQPFNARKVLRGADIDRTKMTKLSDVRKVVETVSEYTFTLTYPMASRAMARLLKTLPQAAECYLYDTANDEGRWCICEEARVEESKQMGDVVITLRDNKKYRRL